MRTVVNCMRCSVQLERVATSVTSKANLGLSIKVKNSYAADNGYDYMRYQSIWLCPHCASAFFVFIAAMPKAK